MPWLAALALAVALALALLYAWRERRRTQRRHTSELHAAGERLRLALQGSHSEFWDFDLAHGTLRRLQAADGAAPVVEQTLQLDAWREKMIHPDDRTRVEAALQAHLDGRTAHLAAEHRQRDASGHWRWVRWSAQVVERDTDGRPLRLAGTLRDIEQQRQQRQQQRIAGQVIQGMAEAVVVTDPEFRFVSCNPAFTRIVGYAEAEIRGRSTALLNSHRHSPALYRHVREMVIHQGSWRGEMWQRCKDGTEFLSWMDITSVPGVQRRHSHHVFVMSDITERKRVEQELRYLANYDPLSGLPNRTLLLQHLEQAIAISRRTTRQLAVLFIDLDRFKQVNDALGHEIGDRMLQAAGARLRANVRPGDVVARLGGDEFCVVAEDIAGTSQATTLAATLVQSFTAALRLDTGQELLTSPSIGVALFPAHGDDATTLLKSADTAMYQAKSEGRNTWALYSAEMEERARRHANLTAALRRALPRGELSLVFQPQLDLRSWQVTGVEALLRWRSEAFGDVPPTRFVPLAEEAGLVGDIGEFVLEEACATLARWRRSAPLDALTMAINVSAAQLLSSRLNARLEDVLARHALPAGTLVLELTEGVVMTRTETSLRNLHALKETGVGIAIDDFGTGYSSLAYLKRLPVDALKIDRDFITDVPGGIGGEYAIASSIIGIGHSLAVAVIAEGVETFAQIVYLERQGCDQIQGHWLSPPLPAGECLEFIRNHSPASRPQFPFPRRVGR